MKKRLIFLILAAIVLLAMATPALAGAPTVEKITYEGGKKVEVDFSGRVSYKSPKVTVKDSSGKKLSAKIVDRDSDDLDFTVSGLKAGGTYTFTISGVRAGSSGSYGTVSGSFSVPLRSEVAIRAVEYDKEDRELDISFNGKVKYKRVKITVKDVSGKKYTAKITDKGSDDLEAKVKGLRDGETYTVTISGVALKGDSFTTVSKSFTVR